MQTKQLANTINLLGILDKAVLSLSDNDKNRSAGIVFMKAITQEEEDKLDKLRDKSDIFFYGDFDINDKADIKIINDHGFTSEKGVMVNNFDYESGTYTLTEQPNGRKEGVTTEWVTKEHKCNNPLEWFKYQYCKIGKPAKIVVYKGEHETFYAKR